jgi:hypothetical protein
VDALKQEKAKALANREADLAGEEKKFRDYRVSHRRKLHDLRIELEGAMNEIGVKCLSYPKKGCTIGDITDVVKLSAPILKRWWSSYRLPYVIETVYLELEVSLLGCVVFVLLSFIYDYVAGGKPKAKVMPSSLVMALVVRMLVTVNVVYKRIPRLHGTPLKLKNKECHAGFEGKDHEV